jgi:hypothetical protein
MSAGAPLLDGSWQPGIEVSSRPAVDVGAPLKGVTFFHEGPRPPIPAAVHTLDYRKAKAIVASAFGRFGARSTRPYRNGRR